LKKALLTVNLLTLEGFLSFINFKFLEMKKYLFIALVAFLAVTSASAQLRIKMGKNSPIEKLGRAEIAITNLYVDSVDENKLVEDAIRGMLEKLDPHSSYATAKETKAMNEPLNGSFDGIGVQFNMVDDTLLVIQPVTNGPSEKVGIIAGDRIVAVNDTAISGVKMSKEEIMKRLRGPKGTTVNLTIVRRGIKDKLIFKVKRDKIPVTTMDAAYMIRPGIGYIRLGSFGLTSHKEVTIAMDSLKKKGMKDLIFDLEDNGGGYLQAAAQIANEFLQKGDLIVYTSGRAAPRQEYKAQANGRWRKGKVVVLTNEFTASAAEIVSGAIQDQDRGVVVGRRTFGKGLVQRPLTFDDGSEIRLTIAHYYTPSGRCIQKPYKKGDRLDYAMDLDKRYKHGEFTNQDSIHLSDSLKYYTLRKHRVVYGGGGIMPDYFVPLDTTKYTKMHRQLAAKSIVINHSLKFIDAHRKELKSQYKDFDKFLATYEVPSSLIDGIIAEGKKEKIEPKDEAELIQTKKYLALQLKALVARDIWDMSQYFQVWNETNEIVQRAVQLLTMGK
jgi:carboxyl-terminal processing protease